VVAQNSSQGKKYHYLLLLVRASENNKSVPLGAESAKIVVKTPGEETKAAQPQLAN